MSNILWSPPPECMVQSNLFQFIKQLETSLQLPFLDYAALHHWSIEHPDQFWPEVWKFCGIKASKGWDRVITHRENMEKAEWFKGCKLNFAENLLRYQDDEAALISVGEAGGRSTLTYGALFEKTMQVASALQAFGVQPGDRVAGYLPNIAETVIAMLAATTLGAIWSSCSPDFGEAGLLDRFSQIKPKILFAANGYLYNGKKIDCQPKIVTLLKNIPQIERVVRVDYLDLPQVHLPKEVVSFNHLLIQRSGVAKRSPLFTQLPFNHPVYILYSSGTTGAPKCMVHGAGGTLLQHLKELMLHVDLKRSDHFFYYTTCGWMMWNWLVSGLSVGATLVLYEGSPLFSSSTRLFDLIDQEQITVFGTSAKFLSSIQKSEISPANTHKLSSLRSVLSTGSPLSPELFDYVYGQIKPDVQLSSISGGTDLISCFALGNPMLPVYRGELQCMGLGMDVQIYDDAGRALIGEKGQLVCTTPFPSQPVAFWNDPDGTKYHNAYFDVFPNTWAQGDYAEITPKGGVVIYGRSDAVLNPGGVRIGTAEIYRPLEHIEEILDAIAVGQPWQGDERVILFVKLKEGMALTEALVEKIKDTIRNHATPRHVPAAIRAVPDIPRTLNGKLAELAVKNAIHGLPVKNKDALANPQSLAFFEGVVGELKL